MMELPYTEGVWW